MATLSTAILGTSPTAIYTSVGNSAITWASFTNYNNVVSAELTLYVVPSGDSPTNENVVIKDFPIVAGDTHQLYSGAEKILLSDGDTLQASCDQATSMNAVVGYTGI